MDDHRVRQEPDLRRYVQVRLSEVELQRRALMSTSIDYVVDVEASLDEAPPLAEQVVKELIQREIVLPTPQIHEYLDGGPRYATGPNVTEVAHHNDCFPCGLDIEIGRAVISPGENGLSSLACPSCNAEYSPDDIDWASAVGEWYAKETTGQLTCAQCGHDPGIVDWRFEPTWGFGNLVFKFTEWFLTDEFVEDLSSQLRHKISRVRCHI